VQLFAEGEKMNALLKKVKIRYFIAACLLLALVLTSSVSAAEANQAPNQAGSDFVPAVYTFEGPVLADVLDKAASTIQACHCQNMVSYFTYERLQPGWYRLSIYMGGLNKDDAIPEIWEIVRFQGSSLPKLLQEAAKYVKNCQCQNVVVTVTYERVVGQADIIAPLHIVSLILESPPPD
jgi:hypothetical protein